MIPSQNWIEQQRSKPSFVVAGQSVGDIAFENTLLHMPQSLQAVSIPAAAVYSNAHNSSLLSVPASSPARAHRGYRASTPPSRAVGVTPTRRNATPIHERLLQRGQLYEQRLEALREKAIQREVRRCRSVPKISAMGHNIQRDSQIEVRLKNVHDEKTQVAAFNMQILEKRERGILEKWFHPQISAKGKRSSGKARKEKKLQHETWEFKRQQRIDELRKEKIVKEMEEMRGMPDIDPRSELLAARRQEREGMAGYTHLEAMLERDRLAKLARWEEQQRAEQQRTIASPKITAFAATMHRHGDVAERLIAEAAAREERRLAREHQRLENEREQGVPSRGEFRPDELLARHMAALQKRDEKLRRIHEAERRQHNPVINPTSDHIASRMEQSTMERLMTPPRARTPTRSEAQAPRSTTPRGTRSTGGGGLDDSQLFQRLQLAEAKRKLHIDAARSERDAREMEECTFQPTTTVGYYPPTASSVAHDAGHGASSHTGDSVYQRMKAWEQRRQDRLDEQRRQDAAEELDGSTFTPRINAPAQNRSGITDAITGFDAFIQRQQSAARQRTGGDSRTPSHTGRGPTEPLAPALGREREVARAPVVLSLQRPVPVPYQADYGTPSQQRYSLTDRQVTANAGPIAHSYLRHTTRDADDASLALTAAVDAVSLDTDEQDPYHYR